MHIFCYCLRSSISAVPVLPELSGAATRHAPCFMFCHLFHKPRSRDSSVSIVPRLEATRSRGKVFFSLTKHPDRFWAHPVFYSVDIGGSFSRVKLLGRESAHSPHVTKIKNDWSYTSTSQYAFKTCIGTALLHSIGTTPTSGGTLWKPIWHKDKHLLV